MIREFILQDKIIRLKYKLFLDKIIVLISKAAVLTVLKRQN